MEYTEETRSEETSDSVKKKHPYQGFTRKERLLPSLLVSIAIPFTLLFFGPFEAYYNNMDEFGFAFGDFIGSALLLAFLLSGVFFAVLWNLSGRVFDVALSLFVGVAFLLFLQGNYLNLGLNAVSGDGVGTATFGVGETIVNTLIWVVVLGGLITASLLLSKKREILRLILLVAMVAVIGVQVINFSVYSLTSEVLTPVADRNEVTEGIKDDIDASEEASVPQILTTANLTELSSQSNVVLFIVDRFDQDFYDNMARKEPDFFDALDGFTLFNNNISKYARTYPSIAYMLTGVENDFSTSRPAFFEKAYGSDTFLHLLKDEGYSINLYIEDYYTYEDASVFAGLAENISSAASYEILDRTALTVNMIRLSLFRYLPIAAKGVVGNISTGDFNRYVRYDSDMPLYSIDMKNVYDIMTEDGFSLQDESKSFVCIHLDGCHTPFKYDENWNELDDDDPARNDYSKAEAGMRSSFAIIEYYIAEMKRLGVYENSTIIITGDHAASYNDSTDLSGSRLTTLLVKEKGSFGTPLVTNTAPVSQDNLHATILQSEGIETDEDFGRSVLDIEEGENGERYYYFQKTVSNAPDEIVVYKVVGDASNFKNWTVVERITVNGALS